MDKPTSLFVTQLRLLTSLWLVVVSASAGLAQNGAINPGGGEFVPEIPASYSGSGSFFNRQLGTAFRFGYHSQGYGTQDGIVSLGTMKVFNGIGSTIFLDGQATLSDEFGGGFNAGVGYRSMNDIGFGPDSIRINGLSFWTDGQSTSADNFFTQLGVAAESLGDTFDLRFQGNFPLDRIKDGELVNVPGSDPQYSQNALLSALQQFARDTALTVVDLEGATRIHDLEAWAFLGGYHLTGDQYDATGYRAGVRGYAVPDVSVSLQVTDDDIYHTNVMFGITWFVGRTNRCNEPCGTLLDRFREPVLRNDYIATTQQLINNPIDPLHDAVSGDEFFIVHVDSNAAPGGDGTYENPYQTLAEAEAGSGEDNIILVHSGSSLAPAGTFTAQNGQRVLGEGLDPNGIFIDHTVNSEEQGIVSLPETSAGSQSVAAPTIAGVGTVFDLADDNEINNFTINGGTTAVNANTVDSPQLANLLINNPTGDAIVFTNVTGSSLIENSVEIYNAGNRGIFVDGGSGVLGANAMIVDSTGRLIEITNRSGGSVTVGELHQNAAGQGIYVHDNSGGSISFSSLADVTTTGSDPNDSAVVLENNSGTSITFQELQASSDDADTFVVTGGGAIAVNDPNDSGFINNTGAASAVVVRGNNNASATGNPTVTIAANVNNSGGGQAVDIQDMTGGGVTVTGEVMDTDGAGGGILVENNTAGNYSFQGAVNLDTGGSNAVTLRNNSGTTISFSDLTATAAGADTFVIDGGGTINVNDPNDTGSISNTGAGSALVVRGDAFAGNGNPTVGVAADVINSGGGQAVDIQDMTGGGVTITGDVTDPNADSMGILVQHNTAGNYLFTGTTTLDTGASQAVTLIDNAGATISFADLHATAAGSDTFVVEGGGMVTVSDDPNNPGSIANTGTGTAVRINGDDLASEGDPTVSIASLVENTGSGLAVDVQFMTSNSVLFTGEIGDSNNLTNGGVQVRDNSGTSTITFTDVVTVNTNTSHGVFLSNNTDATISFNGLDITTAAAFKGFTATGGGNLTVTNVGGTTINQMGAGSDSALELDGMTIDPAGVTFDTVDVTDGGSVAVILKDLDGTGSIAVGADTAAPGTITSSAGALLVDGGANDITFDSDITNTGGNSVVVESRTGGTVTINGDVADSAAGMLIQNNTGGSTNITGALTMNTVGDAFLILGNDGASVNFTSTSDINLGTTAGSGVHLTGTNTDVNVDADITGSSNAAAGPAIDVEGDAMLVVDGNVTTTNGRSIQVHNVTAGVTTFNGDIDDSDEGISVDTNTGGTVNFNGMVALNTGGNNALTIQGNNSATTVNFNAASQLDIDTTTGTGILVNNTGTMNINGTGNTVDSTGGVGIDITNARNLTVNNTTVNASGNAVNVSHDNAVVSKNTFNDLTIESGAIGTSIFANGTGQFDVVMNDVEISGISDEGIFLDTGASADRVDFTITGSLVTAGDNEAFLATLDDTDTANVRFLIDPNNQFSNNSAASATVDILVESGLTLNATVGNGPNDPNDPPSNPIGDRNRFVNLGTAAAFRAEINDGGAGGTLNLDLRDNTAQSGGADDFSLFQTSGTFGLVDPNDTINGFNNVGTVNDNGGTYIEVLPPLLKPTP